MWLPAASPQEARALSPTATRTEILPATDRMSLEADFFPPADPPDEHTVSGTLIAAKRDPEQRTRSPRPPTPGKRERINVCCFQLFSLWSFVTQHRKCVYSQVLPRLLTIYFPVSTHPTLPPCRRQDASSLERDSKTGRQARQRQE